jgi:hypothetical protein
VSRRGGALGFVLLAAALVGAALLTLDRGGDPQRWSASAQPPVAILRALPQDASWLAPDSVFNAAIPANAPLDPRSVALVARLAREASAATTINAERWSTPVYRVGADEPTVPVRLDVRTAPDLQRRLQAVPLPPDAQAAAGTDGDVVVVQASSDTAWELWRLRRVNGVARARWAGVVHPLSRHPGVFRDVPDPAGGWEERWFWGITAAKLVKLGGLMTARELATRSIPHALAIAVPDARARVFAAPAQGTDGVGGGDATLPEGAHLRLDPQLDLAALHLPPVTLAMARAAQRYGIVVNNRTGSTVAFYAEDPHGLGFDPYPAIFAGSTPWQLAHAFPWSHLQVLRMDLRTRPQSSAG